MPKFDYKPDGEVIKKFLRDDQFVRGIRGPVGSGKSVACCVEIFRRACEQAPSTDGIRYTKWAVVRNTNPELRTTTIATWLQWFPEAEWGKFRWSPPYTHHIKRGDIDLEVIFLPLDTPEDVKKLLSLEVTGVWCNEARELPKSIIDGATSRVGRYPSKKDGVGATWHGVILDTNAPETEHWWPIMSGETPLPDHITREQALMLVKPDNWKFYTQPAGMVEIRDGKGELCAYEMNNDCENFENLIPTYYENMIRGKTKSWIDVYVLNRLGTVEEGKPVYQGFTEKTHVATEPLLPADGIPLIIGLDFGLTPSAAFCQRLSNGRWMILRELVAQDMGTIRFAEELRVTLQRYYPDHDYTIYGDPSGDFRAQTDESTPFDILRGAGIKALPAPSNDPVIRVESVNSVLMRMVDGDAGFLLDPENCSTLKTGFLGGYHYRRMQVTGERFDDRPNKNKFSHIHDALQYAIIGAGEGRNIIRGSKPLKPFTAKRDFNVFGRMKKRLAGSRGSKAV
tara:strand:- start:16599 stop:18128 length:1530 start_codon:yes stop_codon:yes gene_type:complete